MEIEERKLDRQLQEVTGPKKENKIYLTEQKPDMTCWFFARGECKRGKTCKYLHEQGGEQGRYKDNLQEKTPYERKNRRNTNQPRRNMTNTNKIDREFGTGFRKQPPIQSLPTSFQHPQRQQRMMSCSICLEDGLVGKASGHKETDHCSFCKTGIHRVEGCEAKWYADKRCWRCGAQAHVQDDCSRPRRSN